MARGCKGAIPHWPRPKVVCKTACGGRDIHAMLFIGGHVQQMPQCATAVFRPAAQRWNGFSVYVGSQTSIFFIYLTRRSNNYITENVLVITKSAYSWFQLLVMKLYDDIIEAGAKDFSLLLTWDYKFPASCSAIVFGSHGHRSLFNRSAMFSYYAHNVYQGFFNCRFPIC